MYFSFIFSLTSMFVFALRKFCEYIMQETHYNMGSVTNSLLPPPPPNFTVARQPLMAHGFLIFENSRLHSDTPQSVGLLWTSDQPDAETST
jgi:hypothetical protein